MTTENETAPAGTEHTLANERVLVVCRHCGKPSPATRSTNGSLRLPSSIDCVACGGADFRVLSVEDLPERW